MKFLDMTPTWRAILPVLVHVATQGETPAARREAMDELYRLADMADAVNAQAKARKEGPQ